MIAPPVRFTCFQPDRDRRWYVYDELLRQVVERDTWFLNATRRAYTEEGKWRAQCRLWIEQEERT